jgi:HD-like signal output (HDOD) protein
MIRVLFVDDDPAVLEGLENRLRPFRQRWHMRFAKGASAALAQLAQHPADVVVSDMRMPEVDGASLLETVRERYPQTVRFMLSGETGQEGAMGVMPLVHQFLSKPCDASVLEQAIERACCLRGVDAAAVDKAVSLLRALPALPRLYWEVAREIDNPRSDLASIAKILEQDVVMTARVLQLANSAFFGAARKINTVREATMLLGLNPIRSLVLSSSFFRAMGENCAPPGFSLADLQRRSLKVAELSAQMLANVEQRQIAFSAGVLHDFGFVLLATNMPKECEEVRNLTVEEGFTQAEAEREVFGCTHADVGGQLLALWGLPIPLIESVAYHLRPSTTGSRVFNSIGAVHVADLIVSAQGQHTQTFERVPDWLYLETAGVADQVTRWLRGEPVQTRL